MSPTKQGIFERRGLVPPPRTPGTLNTFTSARKTKPIQHNHPKREPDPIKVFAKAERKINHRSKAGNAKTKARLLQKLEAMDIDHPDAPYGGARSYRTRSEAKQLRPEQAQLDGQLDVIMTDYVPATTKEPFKSKIGTERCKQDWCPVQEPHYEGLYLHENELAEDGPHNFFGASNPPPEVKESYAKIQAGEAWDGDFYMVRCFIESHDPWFGICRREYLWHWNQ